MDVYLVLDALERSQINADLHIVVDGQAATLFVDQADADNSAPCPNLVLLDLNLPKKSGVEVLKHLRGSARCACARVLIMSSSDAPLDRSAVADLAVSGYFKKPTDYGGFMELGPLVREILEQPS
jgi:two-component system, chemotaxis family, response regulator Rcp1